MTQPHQRWGGILPPHLPGAALFHSSTKSHRDTRFERERHFGIPFQSVRSTGRHRMKFCVPCGWGIIPNKQKGGVCTNTRIACGDLPIMIGHRIQIRHKHIKNEVQGTSCLKPRFVFYDITATPLRQSRL